LTSFYAERVARKMYTLTLVRGVFKHQNCFILYPKWFYSVSD